MIASKTTKYNMRQSLKKNYYASKSIKTTNLDDFTDFTDFTDFKDNNKSKKKNSYNEEVLTKNIKKVIKQIQKTKLKPIDTQCLITIEK